jgi:hypothetical protein
VADVLVLQASAPDVQAGQRVPCLTAVLLCLGASGAGGGSPGGAATGVSWASPGVTTAAARASAKPGGTGVSCWAALLCCRMAACWKQGRLALQVLCWDAQHSPEQLQRLLAQAGRQAGEAAQCTGWAALLAAHERGTPPAPSTGAAAPPCTARTSILRWLLPCRCCRERSEQLCVLCAETLPPRAPIGAGALALC